ncbi:hypothetical protein [Aquimarina sp. MMG016]|uniref:hypothetical protein n=1 Tax=Aquimarina sp. MMG016 TaxID=2822690 RepID=UPI001B3A6DBD|nr:hypothetical protein [Aquimarina sp. MMG016]MBQ4819631.1 hypothetical protein [Aquimarina sp. MMG016]
MKNILCIAMVLIAIQSYAQHKDYTATIQDISQERDKIKNLYDAADAAGKNAIIATTRTYIFQSLVNDVFPFWYGTPWDFNGHTKTPGEGKIACGYFVTTTLQDVGFNIPRYKWAQSASEMFIKKLAHPQVKRFTNAPLTTIQEFLRTSGDGLYLVGLDDHTGFISVDNQKIRFIHASYYQPEIGVMSEPLDSENPLKYSKYRVIGKLLSDTMVRNWIQARRYD